MKEIEACETDTVEKEETTETCPLFMLGLPDDFSSNPQLAALASLLDSDDDENSKLPKTPVEETKFATSSTGGGRIRRQKSRIRRTNEPYSKPAAKKASLGEAQLFLKMWKM